MHDIAQSKIHVKYGKNVFATAKNLVNACFFRYVDLRKEEFKASKSEAPGERHALRATPSRRDEHILVQRNLPRHSPPIFRQGASVTRALKQTLKEKRTLLL